MTGREFEKLARKHLLPHLPGFALKGGHLYALPVDRLWRRFDLYASGFSRESFTIVCSVSPLYVPETIHAYPTGLGDRLPILAGDGDRWWEWTPAAEESETETMRDVLAMIQEVGLPFLSELATPEAVAQRLVQHPSRLDDPHTVEALAYSLILSGQTAAAADSLVQLSRITLRDGINGELPDDWELAVGTRGDAVAAALRLSPGEAVSMLDVWNDEQRAQLRLKRYR